MHITSALVLAAAVGQAAAGAITHGHSGKVHNHAQRHSDFMKREEAAKRGLLGDAVSKLTALGAQLGANSEGNNGNAWIGSEGPYTNEFTNESGEEVVLVVWGPAASWINANKPLITTSVPSNESVTVSFAEGASGGWAGIYPDTELVNGQVFGTWGEYTFDGIYSTYDVSKEVNMNGRGMSIVGPGCTSDMTTCVFECKDKSAKSCWYDYELINCAASNGGGSDAIAMNGGCNGLSGGSGALKTTLH